MNQILDPPFRRISVEGETAVRTVMFYLRAAWVVVPPEIATASGEQGAEEDAGDEVALRSRAVWTFIAECSRMSEAAQAALPQANKEDAFTPWRNTAYVQWAHVFHDVAEFLWDVNGTTIGHWHVDAAKANPDQAFGQLVLYHGQMNNAALQHRFRHNVFVAPAFMDVGVCVRGERLPTDGSESEAGYVLNDRVELETWGKDEDSGDIIWFLRRDVPFKFHVEPASWQDGESEVVDRTGVAAVLIYGNLCLEEHESEEYAETNN